MYNVHTMYTECTQCTMYNLYLSELVLLDQVLLYNLHLLGDVLRDPLEVTLSLLYCHLNVVACSDINHDAFYVS